MKSISDEVTFVTSVLGLGAYNNVVNVTFGTFLWTPEDRKEGDKDKIKVDPDPAISCRLRMDEACAISLRDMLLKRYPLEAGVAAAANGADERPEAGKTH